jgi:hypothetical protein
MWKEKHRVDTNTRPFYMRELNISRFWYLQGALEPIPMDTEGQLYFADRCGIRSGRRVMCNTLHELTSGIWNVLFIEG